MLHMYVIFVLIGKSVNISDVHAHWVIVLHLGLEGCSQPRELWFVDILMYMINKT